MGLVISLVVDILHPYYRVSPPDNLSWKDEDSISIQVKISTPVISDRNSAFDPNAQKRWVDLAKSEIVESS